MLMNIWNKDEGAPMENEYQVLNHLQENEITTQRKISSNTGLSLGAVNLLLKKMTRKGLIKVETLNTRSMRYILTPQGLQEKARLTYSYMRQSYQQLLKINQVLDDLIAENSATLDGYPILLCGPADEISEILIQRLSEHSLLCEAHLEPELLRQKHNLENHLILTWREEEEVALNDQMQLVNIMKLI
jgi:DNA-binding MarR family transcriptional regulator